MAYRTWQLVCAAITTLCVVYLTVPIGGAVHWQRFPGAKLEGNGPMGVLLCNEGEETCLDNIHTAFTAEYSIVQTEKNKKKGFKSKREMVYRFHDCDAITQSVDGTDNPLLVPKDAKTLKNNCKNAKRAHRALVIMYVVYIIGAGIHLVAGDKAPSTNADIAFWMHVAFTVVSWSLLMTLVISHAPEKFRDEGDAEGSYDKPKLVVSTLIVAVVAIVLQFVDLVMTVYAKWSGANLSGAADALFENPMF